jgi:hypothetical protein
MGSVGFVRNAVLRHRGLAAVITLILIGFLVAYLLTPHSGWVKDEALRAHRDAASLPAAGEDYFAPMDKGVTLAAADPADRAAWVRGRNTWMVWTGGNDRFWDQVAATTFGNFDLLKVISSYPGLKFSRDSRFEYLGLINEPCFNKPSGPDPDRFGLWIDTRDGACPPDPFADERRYPGVKIGARGRTVPVGSFYGYPTGVLGLRLFPNPAFDAAARRRWDPVRFYTDPSYYDDAKLVRPYRVGMACAFCHVGMSPVNPPADPEHPQWGNLSGTVGSQYYWVDRIFSWQADPSNYLYQLFHTSRPGALDTSLVSTDYINNPRTMNAIYNVAPRLAQGLALGKETLAGGNLDNRQLPGYFQPPNTAYAPHVLKDASDSVGALGALNRVYLNIGLFSEEWLLHFNPFLGGQEPSPIRIAVARRNSSYWNATETMTPDMARYLIAAGTPDKLAAAPGGQAYLNADAATLDQGKQVFADRCARCHSSKLPPLPTGTRPQDCAAGDYLACWNRYWAWTETDAFRTPMRAIVAQPDFLDGNFLSTDMRVPASLLRTNLCSPLATNAIASKIWDDFSAQSYKDLPSVGKVDVVDPITGRRWDYQLPAGGRGYTRPASLVALWATAPYLLNNSVGHFESKPDVASRMSAFDDAIHQMLWPERREGATTSAGGQIDRLPQDTYLFIPAGYLPGLVQFLLKPLSLIAGDLFVDTTHPTAFVGTTSAGSREVAAVNVAAPLTTFAAGAAVAGPGVAPGARVVRYDAGRAVLELDRAATATAAGAALQVGVPERGIKVGPLLAGTPVNLLAAVELTPDDPSLVARARHDAALVDLLLQLKRDAAAARNAPTPSARATAYAGLESHLYAHSQCPDYVVNRGHYFGTSQLPGEPGLSDADKEALIAFLKSF